MLLLLYYHYYYSNILLSQIILHSVSGHLGCFQFLKVINKAAVEILATFW